MLFKTSDKLQEYAQLSGTVNMVSIKATIGMVEDKHIIPVISKEVYNSLNVAYLAIDNEDNLSITDKALLHKCRCVMGPLICYYYAPKADVQVSDSGVQRVETNSNKTAFQYQNTNYREANLREGEAAIELLLEFLEENSNDYPDWKNSTVFKQYRSLFIKTGKEFNELFPSQTPYRNYWAMRSKMLDVEENNIRQLLGDTLFDTLKTKDLLEQPSFTENETKLLFKVKKVIANLTISYAIPFLSIRIDTNGLTVASSGSNRSTNDNDSTRASANDIAISHLERSCNDTASTWIENITNFLRNNKTDFSDWIGFVKQTVVEDITINNNANLKGVFGLF